MELTSQEKEFIRSSVKTGLDFIHADRRVASTKDDMVRLMKIEGELAVAESAWEKLKRAL